MEFEKEIFSGKKVEDIVKEIYNKQKSQSDSIKFEIHRISEMIEEPGDAIALVDKMKGLYDCSLKNDEVLLKLLTLFQKSAQLEQKANGNIEDFLTGTDFDKLLEELPGINTKAKQITNS